jgi:imidazolonepropionase-like amidohydrolase
MRFTRIIPILVVVCATLSISAQTPEHSKQIVIAASTILDGKGGVLHDTRIVIEGSKIIRIDPKAEPVNYDLRGLTVLPGWIDGHVHISWIFSPDGKNAGVVYKAAAQRARN